MAHRGHWTPALTIAELLTAMTTFLDEPNHLSIANEEACKLCKSSVKEFEREAKRRMATYKA